jgi:plasmid stability protein
MATLNIKNFDDTLYERLKQRAAEQHRSVAQEVTHLLAMAVGGEPRPSILELEGLGRELWHGESAAGHVARERDAWG